MSPLLELFTTVFVLVNSTKDCDDLFLSGKRNRTGYFCAVALSYINDLRTALDANRNMFAEKYYYMIEETDPETFIKAKPFLPIIDDTSRELIDLITDQYRIWEKELAAVFPRVVNAALPMDNMTEGADKSYAHYLNCEIKTYSKKTLTMLYSSLVAFPEKNRYRMSLEYLMKAYGFASLEEAEKAMTR